MIFSHRTNTQGVGEHSFGEPHILMARGRTPHSPLPTPYYTMVDPERGLLAGYSEVPK